jgi:hypothetical protein
VLTTRAFLLIYVSQTCQWLQRMLRNLFVPRQSMRSFSTLRSPGPQGPPRPQIDKESRNTAGPAAEETEKCCDGDKFKLGIVVACCAFIGSVVAFHVITEPPSRQDPGW